MKGIPDIVTLVGSDANNIFAHHIRDPLNSDILQVIANLPMPSAMIYYDGAGTTTRAPGRELYGQQLSVVMVLESEIKNFDFIWSFTRTKPTGFHTTIPRWAATPEFHSMNPYEVTRTPLLAVGETNVSYPEIKFSITEKA